MVGRRTVGVQDGDRRFVGLFSRTSFMGLGTVFFFFLGSGWFRRIKPLEKPKELGHKQFATWPLVLSLPLFYSAQTSLKWAILSFFHSTNFPSSPDSQPMDIPFLCSLTGRNRNEKKTAQVARRLGAYPFSPRAPAPACGRKPPLLPASTFSYSALQDHLPCRGMAGLGDAAKEYIAGSAAGVAQVVVGHPFDTVKVILFPFFFASFSVHLLLIVCIARRVI